MLPVSLNLFAFHIGQPLTITHSNQIKNPQGVCSGMGECPISFFGDGYRLSVIKAFVMLPCCKSVLLKLAWQRALKVAKIECHRNV